jgi:translation initiation factor IF-1
MMKNGKKRVNALEGVIHRVRFEGTDIRYEIHLANDDSVVVVMSSLGAEWLREGEKVTVSFQPEKRHMFLHPPKGLLAELEAE